jgi:hypothetical protein
MSRDYNKYWSSLTASHNDHPGNRFRYHLIAQELSRMGVGHTGLSIAAVAMGLCYRS